MAEDTIRVDLAGKLSGYHILVDPEELTFGLLRKMGGNDPAAVLNAVAAVIVGGDLPKGTDLAGLDRLKASQIQPLLAGVMTAMELTKSTEEPVHEMGRRYDLNDRPADWSTVPARPDLPDVPRVQAGRSGTTPRARFVASNGTAVDHSASAAE